MKRFKVRLSARGTILFEGVVDAPTAVTALLDTVGRHVFDATQARDLTVTVKPS